MTTLYITRGLPGSGKTTMAENWVKDDPAGRARVNRDDLRDMVRGGWLKDGERQIVAVRDAAITALLKRGVDVVCDDTNLPSRTARDLRRLAMLAGAEFKVWDMTWVALATCIKRDQGRERTVGELVIRDMYAKYLKGKPQPLPMPAEDDTTTPPDVYVAPLKAPLAIIVDIDGTVALHGARDPYDESRIHEDRPNIPVIYAVRAMERSGFSVIFCSGRHESCRKATLDWLVDKMGFRPRMLLMRPDGDMRKDAIVKRELFDKHIRHNYDVRAVFDDRNQVVEMWRSLGLTVFQVADGNF